MTILINRELRGKRVRTVDGFNGTVDDVISSGFVLFALVHRDGSDVNSYFGWQLELIEDEGLFCPYCYEPLTRVFVVSESSQMADVDEKGNLSGYEAPDVEFTLRVECACGEDVSHLVTE